jgi:hypothetical protein
VLELMRFMVNPTQQTGSPPRSCVSDFRPRLTLAGSYTASIFEDTRGYPFNQTLSRLLLLLLRHTAALPKYQ